MAPKGLIFDRSGKSVGEQRGERQYRQYRGIHRAQIAATGSPNPQVFLDSDPDGINMNDPVLISFGPNVK